MRLNKHNQKLFDLWENDKIREKDDLEFYCLVVDLSKSKKRRKFVCN